VRKCSSAALVGCTGMQANMDIDLVTDPCVCMMYTLSPLAGLGGGILWRPCTYSLFCSVAENGTETYHWWFRPLPWRLTNVTGAHMSLHVQGGICREERGTCPSHWISGEKTRIRCY